MVGGLGRPGSTYRVIFPPGFPPFQMAGFGPVAAAGSEKFFGARVKTYEAIIIIY